MADNLMTIEGLFDPLLTKRSADDSSASNQDSVWHESGGLDVEELKIGKEKKNNEEITAFLCTFLNMHQIRYPNVSKEIYG